MTAASAESTPVGVPTADAASFGSSVSYCDYIVEHQLARIAPRTVVDFGAGSGKNGVLIRKALGKDIELTAIEGFAPAAEALRKNRNYTHVVLSLLQDWVNQGTEKYDVAVFGDVLEHLTPSQIHQVMRGCVARFKHILIIVPLHDIFQDEMYGNTLEKHKAYITQGFFDRYRPVEKHIVVGNDYTIMSLRISPSPKKPLLRRLQEGGLHVSLLTLQPLGLARPFVDLLKLLLRRKATR